MGYGQNDQDDDSKSPLMSCTVNTGNNGLELPTSSSLVASKKVSLPPGLKTALPIATYCIASIVMTVTNKYVVSGNFNMVFFLLTIQVSL